MKKTAVRLTPKQRANLVESTTKPLRVQFDLSPRSVEELDLAVAQCEATTRAELIRRFIKFGIAMAEIKRRGARVYLVEEEDGKEISKSLLLF